jgi:hypothetical protein
MKEIVLLVLLSSTILFNWVQGKTNISLKDLYKISEMLDFPVTQLLEK